MLASLGLLLASCSSPPAVVPTKNLDRPTDMTFVCLGMVAPDTSGSALLTGQGMEVCHPRSAVDPSVDVNGQRTLGTFAFITNAGRGELAVADMDKGRLLDLTPRAPGYGMLPVGEDPEAVAASSDGCWVVTANRTSCDFTLVDPARLLVGTFSTAAAEAMPASGAGDFYRRLVVRTGSAPGRTLRTTLGEIALLPRAQPTSVCPSAEADPAPPLRAVATFPSCDLVAVLDLSFRDATATITSSYYVRPDLPGGVQAAGPDPVCPDDCAAAAGPDTDGGNGDPDGGAAPSADGGRGRPAYTLQPLALIPDGTRVYVGSLFDTAVTSLDIAASGLDHPVRVELAEDPSGVSRLRLGVDPYATTQVARPDGTAATVTGQFLPGRGAFLYAFTADDSIRVLALDGAQPVECDVNIMATPDRKAQACFPVGSPGRRPLARGPGIRIPTFTNPDSPPPFPRDLAFADLQPSSTDTNYHALSGQFGFVLASNGQVYVLNLAPTGEDGQGPVPPASCATHLPAGTPLPAVATNSFREMRDVGQCARTPLAVSIAPQRTVLQTDQAFATTAAYSAAEGPQVKSFSLDNGVTTSWFDVPDPDMLVSRKWDVVWEGVLPGTARGSGLVRGATPGLPAGRLDDAGANFCAGSVQPGDVLMFSGCTADFECQPDDQFSCQVSVSGARGMCLPRDAATSTRLIELCSRFMGSRMRYEIAQATPTSLSLRLKLDEVPKTTLNPCQQDADCWPDAEHGLPAAGSPDGGGRRAFACVEVRPQERRCVQRCSGHGSDSECRAGHVCEEVPSGGTFCVEAPPIDAACFPQPMTTYSVRAGQGFVVFGQSLPTVHNGRVDTDGTCRYDAAADPSLVARIPLLAPRCPEAFFDQAPIDLATGIAMARPALVQKLPAQAGANPCLYDGIRNDGDASGTADTGAASGKRVRAFFQNPQIRFVLTNLDQYAGDLLAIHFEFQYGFSPITVQIPSLDVLLTMGTRILLGPTQTPESPVRQKTGNTIFPYLYVVDQGRTALTPGSRGQVLRINARAGSNEIATFDTTYSGSSPFQLQ
jgi:hypothetical protein